MVRPKAWAALRLITNSKLDRRLLLRCSWRAEKHCTCSGEAGRWRHFRQKATDLSREDTLTRLPSEGPVERFPVLLQGSPLKRKKRGTPSDL
jgi:hypothetical protein